MTLTLATTTAQGAHPALLAVMPMAICPKYPDGVKEFGEMITGWAAGIFLLAVPIALVVCFLAILFGRIFGMHRAGQTGAVGVAVVLATCMVYVVIWGITSAILKTGCIGSPTAAPPTTRGSVTVSLLRSGPTSRGEWW